MKVTLIYPCIGRRVGMKKYIRTWLMEPVPIASIAALLPADVDRRFYDDRLEPIPYDEPTDLVAISVETYTANRAYQIASEYRKRGVPVAMGGFHATLCPEEVMRYSESIVVGPAEGVFPELIDDFRHGRLKKMYQSTGQAAPAVTPDRTIYRRKKYLPIRLVEFARGCRFKCDFCAITSYYTASHHHRPIDAVVQELRRVRRPGQLVFFIDDNITSDLNAAKELMRALTPLRIRWVSQSAINVAFDEEALSLMRRSGCQGLLVGFESLSPQGLHAMNKGFNLMRGGPAQAMANFRRHGLRVYGTFIFGYDGDTAQTVQSTVQFAQQQGLFIGAFNHITPFPGTPLYARLGQQGRLLYEAWWRDPRYRYNMVPFQPSGMTPQELSQLCVQARRRFYSWPSIFRRATHRVHWSNLYMLVHFLTINAMHQWDVDGRNGLPLGDETWPGPLIHVN